MTEEVLDSQDIGHYARSVRSFNFLHDKPTEDLELEEKNFVYKRWDRIPPDHQLRKICSGLKLYGGNSLFCIHRPSAPEQADTVYDAGEGLFIGYLDHLTPDPQTVRGYFDKWNAPCRPVWRLAKRKR
jgi:hypothetical protein